jgi:thiamine pyrophosphate-dependent acetolactate synthase large subunit-like protein
MRCSAFHDFDLIIILGTRMNCVIAHAAPHRFNKDATIARIDIDFNFDRQSIATYAPGNGSISSRLAR